MEIFAKHAGKKGSGVRMFLTGTSESIYFFKSITTKNKVSISTKSAGGTKGKY